MRYILAARHNANYKSSESLVSVHVRIVYKNKTNRRRKIRIRSGITVGQQSGGTSNQSRYFTMFLAAQMTLLSSRLWSLGWSLEAGKDFVLEEDGDSGHGLGKSNIVRYQKNEHNLNIISPVLNWLISLLISLLSRTVGKSQNKLWETHIGMIRLQLL